MKLYSLGKKKIDLCCKLAPGLEEKARPWGNQSCRDQGWTNWQVGRDRSKEDGQQPNASVQWGESTSSLTLASIHTTAVLWQFCDRLQDTKQKNWYMQWWQLGWGTACQPFSFPGVRPTSGQCQDSSQMTWWSQLASTPHGNSRETNSGNPGKWNKATPSSERQDGCSGLLNVKDNNSSVITKVTCGEDLASAPWLRVSREEQKSIQISNLSFPDFHSSISGP